MNAGGDIATAEEVGQPSQSIMGNLCAFPRSVSCVDCCDENISVQLLRNMEAFERQDCQATIHIYCCDPYYDEAFTIPSLSFLRLHVIHLLSFFLS